MRPLVLCLIVVVAACAGPPPSTAGQSQRGASTDDRAPRESRTLVGGYRFEVTSLSPKLTDSNSPIGTKRLFNADLALIDSAGAARPYLAEALPQLNTMSWQVFPDGRMETTYRLRPGLIWQDGQPLTAADFAFAWQVYTSPSLGIFTPGPEPLMESVAAADDRTLAIQWKSPYPDAGALVTGQLNPLPRHILADDFAAVVQDPAALEGFARHAYWSMEYIGAGPFRVDRWEPGASIEGVAFDGHALGRPKVDRVVLKIIPDENAVLTNVLAGNLHYTTSLALRFEHAMVLKREWEPQRRGAAMMSPNTPATIMVQFRPEFQHTPALFDIRVRRALAHSIDRQALNDGLFEGQGLMAEALAPPRPPYEAGMQKVVSRYPYDPQQTERLMNEAGFVRGRDGIYVSGAGERFAPDFRVNAGTEWERTQAILTATWQRAGIEVQPSVLPAAMSRDAEAQHRFHGIGQRVIGAGEAPWTYLTAAEIGSPADRWRGQNRTGWSDPEFERSWLLYNTTLDPAERMAHAVQLVRIVSEQLPVFMMYYQMIVHAYAASLVGPQEAKVSTLAFWNIHEWELRG